MMQPVHKLAQPHSSARGEQNKHWFGKEAVDQVPGIEGILLSSQETFRPGHIYLKFSHVQTKPEAAFGSCFADMFLSYHFLTCRVFYDPASLRILILNLLEDFGINVQDNRSVSLVIL